MDFNKNKPRRWQTHRHIQTKQQKILFKVIFLTEA